MSGLSVITQPSFSRVWRRDACKLSRLDMGDRGYLSGLNIELDGAAQEATRPDDRPLATEFIQGAERRSVSLKY
jgi:hypothetical protein